jgi:hypothetical protein
MPTESTAESYAPVSEVGNRSGRTRSVNVATPSGTPCSRAPSESATRFAWSSLVGAPGEGAAAIERDVSSTTKTCASVLARRPVRVRTTGCIAATTRSSTIAARSSTRSRLRDAGGGGSRRILRTRSTRRAATTNAASGTITIGARRAARGVRKKTEAASISIHVPGLPLQPRCARSRGGRCSGSARGGRPCSAGRAARSRG